MVRWKRLKCWPVHTAFAWTQIDHYGKWRLFCINTLVLLGSASIHFWDLKLKTTWHAVGVCRGSRYDSSFQCDLRRPWWCWNLEYTRFYHIVTTFLIHRGCTVGPQFNVSAASLMVRVIRLQWLTKVEKVFVENVCIPLHDVSDAKVATVLRQWVYGGWSLYMA